ncbi:hypothetical protein ACLHT0_32355, partial [Pseudomonas aeruginosa]
VCTLRFFASPICCHPFEDDSLNYPVVTVSKGGSTIELTLLSRTLVVPDQTSNASTFWGGIKRGPIISYRFKLADAPTFINF